VAELCGCEPALAPIAAQLAAIYFLPGEAQVRNPHLLQALQAACEQAGVTLLPEHEALDVETVGGRLIGVRTPRGSIRGDRFCFTAGTWTQRLLAPLGVQTGILPIRGQMLLYRCRQRFFTRIINEGSRYIVPRDDGHVLVGSTEEEVGFDSRTTPEMLAELRQFAESLLPELTRGELIRSWAGLRPGSFDGFPYLGRLPTWDNAFIAAGHFRSGLYLSPATAVTMAAVMCDEPPPIDLSPFRVGR
jgi:glycine oxidase